MDPSRHIQNAAGESLNPYAAAIVHERSVMSPASLNVPAWIAVACCGASLGLGSVALLVSLPYGNPNAPPLMQIVGFIGMFMVCPGLGLAGAISMIRRKSYRLSLIGAACLLVPLWGPCFGLTLPIGIWSLAILLRKPVRDSFERGSLALPGGQVSDRYGTSEDAVATASKLDARGDWDAAIDLYRSIAARWPEHAKYAENCIDEVAKKKAASTDASRQ